MNTAGYQSWRNLTFIHWRVPASHLQPLVPASLQIEEFGGSAWIGLVPFAMERIRPWWFVPVPGISWFLETNVRTYVRHSSGKSGVWFFSLDANSRIAVEVARRMWNLPYFNSVMTLSEVVDGKQTLIRYTSQRAGTKFSSTVVSAHSSKAADAAATPGTLEHFLVERYTLFAENACGEILAGDVHHPPYEFRAAECEVIDSSLVAPYLGEPLPRAPDHALWSSGVDVVVERLRRV